MRTTRSPKSRVAPPGDLHLRRLGRKSQEGSARRHGLYPMGDDYEITNGVVTKYISAAGLGIITKRRDAQAAWMHTDRLGSIQAITDNAGAQEWRKTYRPYGETITQSTTHQESRGWIDQRQDDETGLTYLHARYYDPGLGGVPEARSHRARGRTRTAYGYGVRADPANLADPGGLNPVPGFCQPQPNRTPGSTPGADPRVVFIAPGGLRPRQGPRRLLAVAVRRRSRAWRAPRVPGRSGTRLSSSRPTRTPRDTAVSPVLPVPQPTAAQVQEVGDPAGSGTGPGPAPVTSAFPIPAVGAPTVSVEFFIQQSSALGLRGDGRGYNAAPDPDRSRAFFWLNFERGRGYFQANPTCRVSGECRSALPLGRGTSFSVSSSLNLVRVRGGLANSIIPRSPAIDFDMYLAAHSAGVTVVGLRDSFAFRGANGQLRWLCQAPSNGPVRPVSTDGCGVSCVLPGTLANARFKWKAPPSLDAALCPGRGRFCASPHAEHHVG